MSAVTVELPEEASSCLDQLSERSGQSKHDYVLEVLTEHLGDVDDLQIAKQRLEDLKAGRSRTYTLDEVEQRLGLAD